MSTSADIFASALTMPPKDRAALALQLLESLDDSDRVDDDEELAIEVARRLDDVRSGRVATLDGRKAMAAIRKQAKLARAGWRVGTAEEFLGLTPRSAMLERGD